MFEVCLCVSLVLLLRLSGLKCPSPISIWGIFVQLSPHFGWMFAPERPKPEETGQQTSSYLSTNEPEWLVDFNQGGKSIRDNRAAASVTSGLICVFLRTWRERERERDKKTRESSLICAIKICLHLWTWNNRNRERERAQEWDKSRPYIKPAWEVSYLVILVNWGTFCGRPWPLLEHQAIREKFGKWIRKPFTSITALVDASFSLKRQVWS